MTLEIITSDVLSDTRHGFFTRKGGASSGIYKGLNCGYGSSDQSDVVTINRARAAEEFGVAPDHLATVHQVHSSKVVTLNEAPSGETLQADAIVTNTPGLAIAVLTADCQPVLFADHNHGVIGAAHAGWKGALNGVLEATIDAMEALGAERKHIQAAIGPTISQAAYEVGPEFLDEFLAESTQNTRFFVNGQDDRYHFDLPGFSLARLRSLGIENPEWVRHCTYSEPERFYSYRRSVHRKEADYGRLISAIRL